MFWGLISQGEVSKVGGAQCGVQILHSSGRRSRFWVLSLLWVAVPRVGFMVKCCPSLPYPLRFGPFLVCPMHRSCSASFFCRGNCSVCSCRCRVFAGGCEFRIPFPLEPEPWSVFLTGDISPVIKKRAFRLLHGQWEGVGQRKGRELMFIQISCCT